MAPGAVSRFVSGADGVRLHLCDHPGPAGPAGAGTTILCLPGLTRNGRDFEGLAQRLAGRFRLIRMDFRGRGRSGHSPDPMRYVPETYVADVDAVVRQLDLRRVVPIGTSLGGLVAMLYATRHGDRVAGIVLNDVGTEVDPAGLARIASYVGKVPPVRTWDDAAAAIALLDEAVYPGFTATDWQRLARQRYAENDDGIRLDYDLAIAKAFPSAETTPDLWPAFRRLSGTPMLLLRGALSDILAGDTVDRMREAARALTVIEIAGRGHVPTLDEPEAVAAIEAFLAGLPANDTGDQG